MGKGMKKRSNYLAAAALAGTLFMVLAALNDMQKAEGIGLYLQMLLQKNSRTIFDMLVNLCGMLCVALLVFLPCFCLKRRSVGAALRFLSVYLAFTPVVSIARLVGILDGREPLFIREKLLGEGFAAALFEEPAYFAQCLQVGAVLLLLLLAADRLSKEQQTWEAGGENTKSRCEKWQKLFFVFEIILAAVGFLIPGLQTFAWFFITYLLFVQMFAIWENILERNARVLQWSPLLFGFFWLRGIYRLLELMSVF